MFYYPFFNPFFYPYLPHLFNFESTQPLSYNPATRSAQTLTKTNNVQIDFQEENRLSSPFKGPKSPANIDHSMLKKKGLKKQTRQLKKTPSQYSYFLQNERHYQNSSEKPERKYHLQLNQNSQKKLKTNCISNILRLFLRRISTKAQSVQTLIQNIINKHRLNITLNLFLQWLNQQEINHRIYLTLQTVKKYFFGNQSHSQYYKIMRVMFENFIRTESVLCYLTSKKTKKESIRNNLLNLRHISKQLFHQNSK